MEDTLWENCWSEVAYGIQLEMDKADKELFEKALKESKRSGKGVQLGKSARHWSTPLIHSSDSNPFPIPMYVMPVEEIAFSWDELCDKQNQQQKVGDYKISTSGGKPPMAAAAASSMPPPSTIPAGAKAKGKGRGTVEEDEH